VESVTVLITGGCGLIGSHLTELLLEKGYDARVLGLSCHLQNLEPLEGKIDFRRIDIRNFDKLLATMDGDMETVFHLAALINVDQSMDAPREFFECNVLGTMNVLEAVRQKNIPNLVYMSTCEVYGNIPKGGRMKIIQPILGLHTLLVNLQQRATSFPTITLMVNIQE